MKKYDIVMFESNFWNKAHYEVVLKNSALILHKAGLKVAVVNYIKNNYFHRNQLYNIIEVSIKSSFPSRYNVIKEKNKVIRLLKKEILMIRRYIFFNELFSKIANLSDAFYFGTLTLDSFPLLFIKKNKKKIFFWGYRSFYLSKPYYFLKNPFSVIKSLTMKIKLLKKSKYSLFVSNIFIAKEFRDIGFNTKNIIERPEITINKSAEPKYELLSKEFSLLTIGFIRKDKNIDFAIKAVKDESIKYTIAGMSKNQYALNLDKEIKEKEYRNIIRINSFLPKDEYKRLILKSHFLIFCDEKDKSIKSNGTLIEAIFNYRPVIVPDYLPFNYYIDNYNIGIKYKPNNARSFLEAIYKAKKIGTVNFFDGMKNFQREYLIHNISVKETQKVLKFIRT